MRIIDVHSHNFPDSIAARAMTGMCEQTLGRLVAVGDGTMANHLAHMEMAGVTQAVMCPVSTKPGMFDGILRNAIAVRDGELGEWIQRSFIPFASVHPLDPQLLEHVKQIAAAGIKGIKFHCYYQKFSLVDAKLLPMFQLIADLGLVVQCHCGNDISWRDVRGLCGPDEVYALMRKVPKLKLIAAHLGGCFGYPANAVDRLQDTGIYIDTSVLSLTWHYDETNRVLRTWPRERILFGSDFPWTYYPEAIAWVKRVRDSRDWDRLFWQNATELLGLAN